MASTTWLAATLVLLGTGAVAQAAPVTFFGENLTPAETVSGDPLTARNAFIAALTDVGVEDLEDLAGTPPLGLTFDGSAGPVTATLLATGGQIVGGPALGRFATSGTNWLNVNLPPSTTILFETPVSAFGFYATDVGDVGSQMQVEATNGNVVTFDLDTTVGGPGGSLVFFGFIDPDNTYTSVTISMSEPQEGFGLDDLTVGTPIAPIPEPGTWALFGLGLLGFAGAVRRRRGQRPQADATA